MENMNGPLTYGGRLDWGNKSGVGGPRAYRRWTGARYSSCGKEVGLNAGNTFSIREDQDALCEYRGAGKPSSTEVIHDDDLVYGS
ncbi:MAG: hypothetical protein WBQ34_00905, partial [Candidatus Acidiferrales bacterium]